MNQLSSKIQSFFSPKKLPGFIWGFLVYLIFGALLILFLKKGDIVLWINSYSTKNLDRVFLIITDIGLGSFVAILGAILLFYRIRWSLMVLSSLAFVGVFTNVLKKFVFNGFERPFFYFYYDDFPRFLHDAPLIYFNSFPSGHTMTIFAMCSMLAYLINKKAVGFLLFTLALIVGISRIYLLQHFFMDTYLGAILGVFSSLIAIAILNKFLDHKKFPFMQKSIVQLFIRGTN